MQFIHLDSIDDERVAAYEISRNQLRGSLGQQGPVHRESPKVIDRAHNAGREPISLLVEEPWIDGMSTPSTSSRRWGDGIPVYVASPEQLKRLTGYRFASRRPMRDATLVALPSVEGQCGRRRVAVMENRRPCTHVGALDAFGSRARTWMPCWSHPLPVIRCTGAPPACRWARCSRFRGPVSPGSTTTAPKTNITGRSPASTSWKSLGFTTVAMALGGFHFDFQELFAV